MCDVVRGDKYNLRKSANRNAQISVIHSAHCTDLCFAICRFSQVVFVTSNNVTRVETNCSLVISNSSSSNERIFEYFRILDRKVVANGAVRIRHSSHGFGWQSSHSVDSLGGKPKRLPLKFGYHDVMRTSPIQCSHHPNTARTRSKAQHTLTKKPVALPGRFSGNVSLALFLYT